MIKNFMQLLTVDRIYLFSIIFMIVYIITTKNLLDVVYLLVIISIYLKLKIDQWIKYH